jgi:hypothetical protein
MVDRYRTLGVSGPTSVADWTTGRILAEGFSTPEDAEAAAKLANMVYREGRITAQADARRALGIESDD